MIVLLGAGSDLQSFAGATVDANGRSTIHIHWKQLLSLTRKTVETAFDGVKRETVKMFVLDKEGKVLVIRWQYGGDNGVVFAVPPNDSVCTLGHSAGDVARAGAREPVLELRASIIFCDHD